MSKTIYISQLRRLLEEVEQIKGDMEVFIINDKYHSRITQKNWFINKNLDDTHTFFLTTDCIEDEVLHDETEDDNQN
jgi:hypothetical protein